MSGFWIRVKVPSLYLKSLSAAWVLFCELLSSLDSNLKQYFSLTMFLHSITTLLFIYHPQVAAKIPAKVLIFRDGPIRTPDQWQLLFSHLIQWWRSLSWWLGGVTGIVVTLSAWAAISYSEFVWLWRGVRVGLHLRYLSSVGRAFDSHLITRKTHDQTNQLSQLAHCWVSTHLLQCKCRRLDTRLEVKQLLSNTVSKPKPSF